MVLARLQTCPISFASQMSFSLLVFDDTAATPVSPVWAAVPLPVPGKILNTPHITRSMILNKLACLPVGNRFYCIQHSKHVKTLAHLYCQSEKIKTKTKAKTARVAKTTSQESSAV